MRLFAFTWIGWWIRRVFVVRGMSSDIRQASTRLWPMIWTGLWIWKEEHHESSLMIRFITSVASWALCCGESVCHVSIRLLASIWVGRWMTYCLVGRNDFSVVRQVSMRLWARIRIGFRVWKERSDEYYFTSEFLTSVALRARRCEVSVCQVSTRLLASTWIGRWITYCLLEESGFSDVLHVSTRLCPIIWTGLWICMGTDYSYSKERDQKSLLPSHYMLFVALLFSAMYQYDFYLESEWDDV